MKILFITHLNDNTTSLNDIIHDSVLHGLREIYGHNVIDYPGAWYMYEEEVKKKNFDIKSLWGNGFTYYNLLSNYDQIDRTDIKNRILNNYFDIIIFETLGVGQVEIDVMNEADTVAVILVPESGDDIQMMKSGLIEIADIYIVNK